jgi:reverse gyrase
MNESGPKLLIVESPAKIKTISKFLGKEFKIMSTFGHVKDLPERVLGIDRDEKTNEIIIKYAVLKDKANVVSDICKQARVASEIYLASDPDREGEIIAFHIGQEIEKVAPYTVTKTKAKLEPTDEREIELIDFTSHALTFALINAVKEQQAEIEQLRERITKLEGI